MTEPKSVASQDCRDCLGNGHICVCPDCQGVPAHMCRNPARYYTHNFAHFERLTRACSTCNGTGKISMEKT